MIFLAVEDGGSRLHRWERELNGLLQAFGSNDRICGTYHLGWDTHRFELLLVVRSRLRAIVGDEDDLFACPLRRVKGPFWGERWDQ